MTTTSPSDSLNQNDGLNPSVQTPSAQALSVQATPIAAPNASATMAGGSMPSPVLAFVGRKNSGKTTLLVKLIAELTARGLDVATLKHHGHPNFEIDVEGKDSWRHRKAGAKTTAVLSDKSFAFMQETPVPSTWQEAMRHFVGHDLVLVEGFRNMGLPTVEIMRAASERDQGYVPTFLQLLESDARDANKPQAAVSDISQVIEACASHGMECFHPDDTASLANYVQANFLRPQLTIAIQAGGESKRMGRSKALVPFLGKPLIETMVERLEPIADQLIITTNEPDELRFLLDEHPGIQLVPDILDERGSIPGLITALRHAECPFVSVVACDMIAVSPKLIAAQLNVLSHKDAQAIIPATKHGLEPFAGVYRTRDFLSIVEEGYSEGIVRFRTMLGKLDKIDLRHDNPYGIKFPLGCFMNVNTPNELEFAERLIEATM